MLIKHQVVDTFGGRMHIRWDEGAAATPADRKSNRMKTSMAQGFGIPSLTLGLLGC
jgi:hypothetical protein